MPTLPAAMIAVLAAFAPLFSARVWVNAHVLLIGAILAPAQRTAAALCVTGLGQVPRFHRHHRGLRRAEWSGLAVGRVLLGLLAAAFASACSASTTRCNAAAARGSRPKASTATRCGPATATSSKPAGCAGSA